MKICFINPSANQRPEIYDLAQHLPEEYDMLILQPSRQTHHTPGFCLGKNIHIKYVSSSFVRIFNSVVTVPLFQAWFRELLGAVRESQCDLIHVCDYEYLTSLFPVLLKRSLRIPMLIVNDALLGIKGYSLGFSTLDFLSRIYTFSVGKKILEAYDKVVLLYSRLAEEAYGLGIAVDKIATIPNGIDSQKINRVAQDMDVNHIRCKYGLEDNEKVVLYVGRLVSVKRVHILIEVVKKLIQQGFRVRAIIVGDGPLRNKLENLASSFREKIIFTGTLVGKEKYECYKIAHLFMLPSLCEGLPTVLLESSAMGLPSVATNVNGIPDIVIQGKTGFLVDQSGSTSFLKRAKTLLEHEDLAREMGRNAKKHMEKNFSWQIIAAKYQTIYQRLTTVNAN